MDTGVNSMNASSTRAAITTATVSHVRLVNIPPLNPPPTEVPLSLSALLALLTGGLNVPTQLELIAYRDGPCQPAIRIAADEMLTPSLIAIRC